MGDPERYRTREEVKKMIDERDPIKLYKNRLLVEGLTNEAGIAKLYDQAELEIQAAIDFAEASPFPDPQEALDDLFSFSPMEFPEVQQ